MSTYVKLTKWGKWHAARKGKTLCLLTGKPRKTADDIGTEPVCVDCTRVILVGGDFGVLARTYRTRMAVEGMTQAVVAPEPRAPIPRRPAVVVYEPEHTFPTTQVVIVVALVAGIIMLLAGLFG